MSAMAVVLEVSGIALTARIEFDAALSLNPGMHLRSARYFPLHRQRRPRGLGSRSTRAALIGASCQWRPL